MAAPKITLYTNRLCPWAHRAHIALKELGLQYEEVTIDLDKPREPWYLEINPRGLVPAISYNGTIITESAIVTQLLADAHPSPTFLPPSNSGAIQRARIAFFVDAFIGKVVPHFMASARATTDADRLVAAEALVAAVEKEIEPLLEHNNNGNGPFFGGSEKITLAEALTGSFVLRISSFHKPQYNLVSAELPALLEKRTPRFVKWAQAVVQQESVNYIWDEEKVGKRMVARYQNAAKH